MLIENSITWANCKVKVKIAVRNENNCLFFFSKRKKMIIKKIQSVFRVGVCALHTLGRHVVNEPKVGCPVVMGSKYCKSDFRRIIHLRLYSGPLRL